MNSDELREYIEEKLEPVAGQVAFLPWLQMRVPVHVAGVDFVPYRDQNGEVNEVHRDAESSLTMIFSSYVDRNNEPVECPVIQRFGRIDRIGSLSHTVQLVNFWPTEDLNKYINLKNRVEARMALVDIAATVENNILQSSEIDELT